MKTESEQIIGLPVFPHFKHIELKDREAIAAITSRFLPFSDFTFTSLWSWDTNAGRRIAELNGNLVVLFTDYNTLTPFLSFIGGNDPEGTALELLRQAPSMGLRSVLRLVPSVVVETMGGSLLEISEDRNSFDYIYSVNELASYAGKKFRSKRHNVRRFERAHPDAHVEFAQLSDPRMSTNIGRVLKRWEARKLERNKGYDFEQEKQAFERLLSTGETHNLLVGAVFDGDVMHGFTIEDIGGGYSTGQFWKADVAHTGVYELLAQKTALHLKTLGVVWWNWEQDLGDETLRTSKHSYRPVGFLKKYNVALKAS